MIIISDTRQKVGKHDNIEYYLINNGIEIVSQCLKVGDYMLGEKINDKIVPIGNITIDTKQSLLEVIQDLNDHNRFHAECERASQLGLKLVFLIENSKHIQKLEDVAYWKNPNFSKAKICMNGRTLMEKMYSLQIMYNVEWIFVSELKDTAKKIIEILN